MKDIFKHGDKVYCPTLGQEIYTVKLTNVYENPLAVNGKYPVFIQEDGRQGFYAALQAVFHATPENHKLLEELYKVEFEKPKRVLKGSELCKYLLKKTKHHVFCFVSNTCDADAISYEAVRCITSYDPYKDYSFSVLDGSCGHAYDYAVPINPETLEVLEMEVDDE